MGTFSKVFHKCDRCGVTQEMPFKGFSQNVGPCTLSASIDYDVAAGPGVTWHELCPKCAEDVYHFILLLTKSAGGKLLPELVAVPVTSKEQ